MDIQEGAFAFFPCVPGTVEGHTSFWVPGTWDGYVADGLLGAVSAVTIYGDKRVPCLDAASGIEQLGHAGDEPAAIRSVSGLSREAARSQELWRSGE